MKEGMFFTLLLVFLCFLSIPCFAEDDMILINPVNPYQAEVWKQERELNTLAPKVQTQDIQAVRTQEPTLGGYGEWTVTYDTSHGDVKKLSYGLLVFEEFKEDNFWRYIYRYVDPPIEQGQQIFTSCQIVTAGDYWLFINAVYEDETTGIVNDYFTITESGKTSLQKKVDEIVDECSDSTQWQTALNLHDWLITNIYYDQTYHYYGADGLLRGYGVCDTYSKAYWLLCEAAGIPVGRITNNGHAWNVIQLDGEWYFIDTTWDDPIPSEGGSVPLSGVERRFYFCLNEDAISRDHPLNYTYEDGEVSCTAMDMNYYIKSGDWKDWKINNSQIKPPILDAFNTGGLETKYLIDGNAAITLKYLDGSSRKNSDKLALKIVLAYALEQEPFTLNNGDSILLRASYPPVELIQDDWAVELSLGGWAIEETGSLILPAELQSIPTEGFTGIKATTVIIPDGCESIESKSFFSSGVRTVIIPDSVTFIADDAFQNCGRIIMKTDNQYAIEYASEHDMIAISR